MSDLKEMIKGKKVNFLFYRKAELWYETECGFKFPVPIDDTGDGQFNVQDNAMYFMRYIRKHLDAIKKEKENGQKNI